MCSPTLARPEPKTVLTASAGAIVGVAVLFLPPVYKAAGPEVVNWVFNIAEVIAAMALMVLIVRVWWAAEPGETLKTISGFMAAGLVLWALGQAVYGYYQVQLGPDFTGATLADGLWLVGYVPVITALILRLHTFGLRLTALRWSAVLGANLLLDAVVIAFVVRPIIEHPNPSQPLMTIINLLYIVGDLVVVLAASLIVQSFSSGAMSMPWSVVASGCLMFCCSDLLFAYGTWNGSFAGPGSTLTPVMLGYNLLFFSAYVTGAAGTYWLGRMHRIL